MGQNTLLFHFKITLLFIFSFFSKFIFFLQLMKKVPASNCSHRGLSKGLGCFDRMYFESNIPYDTGVFGVFLKRFSPFYYLCRFQGLVIRRFENFKEKMFFLKSLCFPVIFCQNTS